MKKLLYIIPVLIAIAAILLWSMRLTVSPGGGMVSISLSSNVAKAEELTTTPVYEAPVVTEDAINLFTIDFKGSKNRVKIGEGTNNFITKMLFGAFDDECDISLSLVNDVGNFGKATLTGTGENAVITVENNSFKMVYKPTSNTTGFNEQGGVDYFITIKKKTSYNIIDFNMALNNAVAYHQPALTQAEIDEGAYRPEYVVNSVAFYHASKGGAVTSEDTSRGITTGKIGHLYAMRVIDANQNQTWAGWTIEPNNILRLTIPLTFLQTATYPVTISPVGDTFGYTTIGGSITTYESVNYYGPYRSIYNSESAGTGTSISVHRTQSGYGGQYLKCALYQGATYLDVASASVTSAATGWSTNNFSGSPAIPASTSMGLAFHTDDTHSSTGFSYDSGGTHGFDTTTYPNFPATWSNDSSGTRKYSIYCTYTPSGGGAAPSVTTGSASNIDCESFDIWGIITDNHTGTPTTVGFYYGIGGFTANVSGTYSTDNFTLNISSLADDTEYMVKAFAINEYGTGNGTSVNVTTLASSDPTFTTQAATNILDTSARLNGTISGLDCDDSDDVFWEWGLSSGNYTANYTDTTDRGNGAVYYDLTSLTANTTYYFRGCARLSGGAYQCGGELSFTTENLTIVCLSPTSLVLSILSDNRIYAEWIAIDNITDYLLLVSTIDYPDDPEGTYGYAVAYSGTATSATLEGYETDITEYFFSLWTHCNPYSDDYVTASIGGAGLEDLTLSLQNIGGVIIGMVPLIAFSVISFWKENSVMFGLTAGISIAEGFYCYNIDSSPFMFGISLVLWVYAIICLAFGLMCMFKRSPTD